MADATPTRSAVLELKEERHAMHEGHVFLDEKCLLLAGEILRELALHEKAERALVAAHDAALIALKCAVARHGLEGLQVYPSADLADVRLQTTRRGLMGVALQHAVLEGLSAVPASAADRSPEAERCRIAFRELLDCAVAMAAHAGNLERLSLEYRRSIRRARALQDVLLPECDRAIAGIESRLEELEQEDAVWMRIDAVRRDR
jgi:V/A-type H+/Na+-transporting ATPase subunit D